MSMEEGLYDTEGENRWTRRKTCPSATLSTTNPTRNVMESKTSLRYDRSANNRVTVRIMFIFSLAHAFTVKLRNLRF